MAFWGLEILQGGGIWHACNNGLKLEAGHGRGLETCGKPAAPPGVVTSRFEYDFEDAPYDGYVAHPENPDAEKIPIALVVHAIGGEGEVEDYRADQLASLGFIAFAVDLFGKDKRPTALEGRTYVNQSYSDMDRLHRQLARQVSALAAAFPIADADRFVVAGYCYGGNIALEYFRGNFPGLQAAVSFHGTFMGAPASAVVAPLGAAVQVHHADDDFQDLDIGIWAIPPPGNSTEGGMQSGSGMPAGGWDVSGRFADAQGGGSLPRKDVSVLTVVEKELRDAGAARWSTLRYGKVGHAWTVTPSRANETTVFECEPRPFMR